MGDTINLKMLRRDATLMRFFHGFTITAPQIIIHLYAITVATDSTHPDTENYRATLQVVFALCVCIASLVYSILTYVTSDRLTNRIRRVIVPAHLALTGWYVCIVVSRIVALTLFTHAFGYYVLVFLIFHWILSVVGILNQKTEFCIDYAQQPKKPRWTLEVLFSLFAACLYQFVFFSLKEGPTRYAVSVYLVVTLIENVIMIALFFTEYSSLWYAPASIAIVVGLFLLGVLLLLVYYLVLHPDKTEDWYWIGIPTKCCRLSGKGKSYQPHSVEISAPTLVNMNGHATNLSSRMSGLQPLSSILSRNKTTGQMQLTAPPQVIDSGLPRRGGGEMYKKPQIIAPPSSSSQQQQQQQQHNRSVPNPMYQQRKLVTSSRLPISHQQSPGSTFSSEHASAGEMARVQVLTIPTSISLGSSGRTDSEDIDVPDTTTESLQPVDSSIHMASQMSVGLHMDSQIESAIQALSLDVPNTSVRVNANASNANKRHDRDIDSPLASPYDTLEKTRKEVMRVKESTPIREEDEGRYSASPPCLPTPDFTGISMLPGQHYQPQDQQYQQQDLHQQQVAPLEPRLHNAPQRQQQNILVGGPPQIQQLPTATQNSASISAPQPPMAPQPQQMFRDIPAKRDYLAQPSKLEQHYFPDPSSSSTPNLPAKGAKNGVGGQNGDEIHPRVASVKRHRSLPPSESTNIVPKGKTPPTQHLHVPPPSPIKAERQAVDNSNRSPERSRGRHHHRSPNAQRGGRGRGGGGGGGGGGSRSPKKERNGTQSYYAYSSSPSKPAAQSSIIARPHSFHAPQVAAENQQKLFGRTIPVLVGTPSVVAPGKPTMQSSWQQQQMNGMPVHVAIPQPPQQKQPSRSPDRSRANQFQTSKQPTSTGSQAARPRSYSEGSALTQQEKQKHNQSDPAGSQNQTIGPQYSQHYLGRSPGAPRRGPQQSFYVPTDRTQVLNLTWTSPKLHHDPAISGQNRSRAKTAYEPGPYGNGGSNPHTPPTFHRDRSKTSYELGPYGNSPQIYHKKDRGGHANGKVNRGNGGGRGNLTPPRGNPLQPPAVNGTGHKYSASPPGARKLSTNQNPGKTNPLLHVPVTVQGTHTSRV